MKKRKLKSSERFLKQETSYGWRNIKTGRYTKTHRSSKNIKRERHLTLYTSDTKTGEIRKYGSIREPSRRRLLSSEGTGNNVFIKAVLRDKKIFRRAAKSGAKGLEVTIRAKGKRKKDVSIKTKIIFDANKLNDQKYLSKVTLGKVMKMLAARNFRLSDELISSHKKYFQLSQVKISVNSFQ